MDAVAADCVNGPFGINLKQTNDKVYLILAYFHKQKPGLLIAGSLIC